MGRWSIYFSLTSSCSLHSTSMAQSLAHVVRVSSNLKWQVHHWVPGLTVSQDRAGSQKLYQLDAAPLPCFGRVWPHWKARPRMCQPPASSQWSLGKRMPWKPKRPGTPATLSPCALHMFPHLSTSLRLPLKMEPKFLHLRLLWGLHKTMETQHTTQTNSWTNNTYFYFLLTFPTCSLTSIRTLPLHFIFYYGFLMKLMFIVLKRVGIRKLKSLRIPL